MPAFRMKTKPVPCCVSEGNLLGICPESSKICKKKHTVILQSNQTLVEVTRACQNGHSEIAELTMETAPSESSLETCNGRDNFNFQEWLFPDGNLFSAKMMDFSYPMNLESLHSLSLCAKFKSDASNEPVGCEDTHSVSKISLGNCDCQCHNASSPWSSNEFGQSICETTAAALADDEATELDEIFRISLLQELGFSESNLIFDAMDGCFLFSSIDEKANTPTFQDKGSGGELLTNSDASWFQRVTHQAKPSDQSHLSSGSLDSDETGSFDSHLFIRNFLDLSDFETSSLPDLLPKETCKQKRVTLVLDLDETLVHSTTQPCEDADFTFKIVFNMGEHTVYVRKRPSLATFLERVSEMFEIVIFTASESVYAKQLLDILDPEGKFFSRRVYRDSCTVINGNYTKDLSVLGVDLSRCAIVDNCPQVFQLQVSNGIPIKSWFDDASDDALLSLLPFLETLAGAEDVRPIITEKFRCQGGVS
ncbi:hypothetical protein SAY87_006954 [Trapa incisa]|uniref:FCP1 homology domain-containing protein n=1 Tax=Trapa incisa TaxID=236973 RepID=A0AAN7PZF0_9MYRT|nr:hypothetical protein SAY87_006954 [Trapa incisa]